MLGQLHLDTVSLVLQTALRCPHDGMAAAMTNAFVEAVPALDAGASLMSAFFGRLEAFSLQALRSRSAATMAHPVETTVAQVGALGGGGGRLGEGGEWAGGGGVRRHGRGDLWHGGAGGQCSRPRAGPPRW